MLRRLVVANALAAVVTATLAVAQVEWTERVLRNRGHHAMAFDSARGRVVLFGGSPRTADTWEWDGSDWTRRFPQTIPPDAVHQMENAPALKRLGNVGIMHDRYYIPVFNGRLTKSAPSRALGSSVELEGAMDGAHRARGVVLGHDERDVALGRPL